MRDLYDDRNKPPAVHHSHRHQVVDYGGGIFFVIGIICLIIAVGLSMAMVAAL